MKKSFPFVAGFLLLFSLSAVSQSVLHRVLVLNEGHFDYVTMQQDVPVTVGAYDPQTSQYATVITVPGARFASDMLLDAGNLYVAADSFILKYDADSYQLLNGQVVHGARKLAVWNNQLIVSRGEYGISYNSYFQVFDKGDLHFIYELPVSSGPAYATEGMVISQDSLYIAVNNGFSWGNEVGYVGVVDLQHQQHIHEMDLGLHGTNPEALFLDAGKIYSVNNRSYNASSISTIDLSTEQPQTVDINLVSGCNGSAYANGQVLFQASSDDFIGKFNTSNHSIDSVHINKHVYCIRQSALNNLMYVSETDYTSYGIVYLYTPAGQLTDVFACGVAPGTIIFDVRNATGVTQTTASDLELFAYPSPADNDLTLAYRRLSASGRLLVTDALGRVVLEKELYAAQDRSTLSLKGWSPGIYQASIQTGRQLQTIHFIKQ